MKQTLFPNLDDLRAEHVLVQAWKKTATYLRQHSWYADTLELDYQSLRLPDFIRELQERLKNPESWVSAPLAIVPAPKSQPWELKGKNWRPKDDAPIKIRPLVHVSLSDQVVATAMLLCLADQVERRLGNPLLSIEQPGNRRRVLAYGHRLFCDSTDEELRHRWGSSKLYRLYYRDYQTFLRRPELVSDHLGREEKNREFAIVQSDLSKFYDRVRPALLHEMVRPLTTGNDPEFFALFQKVFAWGWQNWERAAEYAAAQIPVIPNFESIALPQGLVASGFFANVALHHFDAALRDHFDQSIDAQGEFILRDVCYYVDDMRLVLSVKRGSDERQISEAVHRWLQKLLNQHAGGLLVEETKTKATVVGRQKRFLVQQSKTAKRIQQDVSGVFDMLHGTELIGAIEGFFLTQKRYSSQAAEDNTIATGLITGTSDMRDDTATRFAAGRYRRTFRSLRPLLQDEDITLDTPVSRIPTGNASAARPAHLVLSKQQLDERGKLFSSTLIEEWVCDPSNVRLLRIALDLYPDVEFLKTILGLLKPAWQSSRLPAANREVQQYCLAEIFRAGATETGMVSDQDCLPSGVNLPAYHERLRQEAKDILKACLASPRATKRYPWYLLQQILLYLAAQNELPIRLIASPRFRHPELRLHRRLLSFMVGRVIEPMHERAILLILANTAFGHDDAIPNMANSRMPAEFLRAVFEISPETGQALWLQAKQFQSDEQKQMVIFLGLEPTETGSDSASLNSIVRSENNPFWQEHNLLKLAAALLEQRDHWPVVLSPWQIQCAASIFDEAHLDYPEINSVTISGNAPVVSWLFNCPTWCQDREDRQRFQLGMLLRFALRGSLDVYGNSPKQRPNHACRYRQPVSHWERQRYATFQGRSAFGPAWIPISSWAEKLLFDLLRWPGAGVAKPPKDLMSWQDELRSRIIQLKARYGAASKLPFLEQEAPPPTKHGDTWDRPLRVGIVQSVTPHMDDYAAHPNDPQLLNDPHLRAKQRSHLASVMEAVSQTLQLRESHLPQLRADGQIIDLLIFPELAVHPLDVDKLILPFVRSQKCMVLFGQVYHPKNSNPSAPLINSCLWMIPEWNHATGFQVRIVEQGKQNLTSDERKTFTPAPIEFRPAQWIIEYQWNSSPTCRPLKLSASICYDATDLALASDLKMRNDLYIVCALNRDVGTFDRMSEGLHYHMYQGVIVVNNGQFGGSSFYMPFSESFHRQVFHLHGQPQASIAFAEITPQKLIDRPNQNINAPPIGEWKTPPANWNPF